jgi:NifU-like protein involved in Fe-S cluster formation
MVKLYTPELLSLAADLALFPLSDELPLRCEARSRTCGSKIEIALNCDESGAISALGMKVAACAIGQSSAALLAQSALGRPAADIANCRTALETWLSGKGSLPHWPGIAALVPALDHKGRHEALLLPWKAAEQALSTAQMNR